MRKIEVAPLRCPTCDGLFRPKPHRAATAKHCSAFCRRSHPVGLRFWALIDVRGDDDCWHWKAYRNAGGYGNVVINGRQEKAHRVAYSLAKGPIPEGEVVCHRCDNPPCCNPNHLLAAPQIVNVADRDMKGHGARLKGSKNGFAKLTEWQVAEIKKQVGPHGSGAQLARKYNVSESTISLIKRGVFWKHVTGAAA